MNNYLFKTNTTMKEYNRKNYWVDRDYIGKEYTIKANNVEEALQLYAKEVNGDYYDIISDSALKNKQPMYIDTKEGTKQIGYVITGNILIDNGYRYIKQYVDLWIEISKIENAFI